MFNSSEVVERVHGLNNVSTLERRRRIAEIEAGILFPKKTLQNKRGFSAEFAPTGHPARFSGTQEPVGAG